MQETAFWVRLFYTKIATDEAFAFADLGAKPRGQIIRCTVGYLGSINRFEDCFEESRHVRVKQLPHRRAASYAAPFQRPLRKRFIFAYPFAGSSCAIPGSFLR